jgi:hypothetical protein
MPAPGQQVCPVCQRLPFVFIFKVVVPSLSLHVLGFEEEVAASHLETVDLHRHLNDLEGRHEALVYAALDVVRVVRPEVQLLPDCFRSLLCQVRGAVAFGIHRGLASALASARVRSGSDLDRLDPRFQVETSPQERRALITVFARAATVITVEVDVNDILTRGAYPSQDGV